MRAPEFWNDRGLVSHLLTPLGSLYDLTGQLRRSLQENYEPGVPVICVGNIVSGGSGKTPVVLNLVSELLEIGRRPAVLSRGYGGKLTGPAQVNSQQHDFRDVGDEPLLLARKAPTWVGRNRRITADAAVQAGADVLIMDDGFQNDSLQKTLNFVVVDGGFGFGNSRVIPAGPLRENLHRGLARADAFVLVGKAPESLSETLRKSGAPIFQARFIPSVSSAKISQQKIFGFAGIGRPAKFADTLRELGADLVGFQAFPDHHVYRSHEIMAVVEAAASLDATPITTEKDAVRLSVSARSMVQALAVTLQFQAPADISKLLRMTLENFENKAAT